MSRLRLSVVVAGSRPQGPPAELFESLAPGLGDGTLEIIVSTAAPGDAFPSLPGVRPLRSRPGTTIPRLRAAGLAAARAPIVALTEDFCIPGPGWANAHLAAHEGRQAVAVGGPVTRRQGTSAQWALTFCEYGRFFHPSREGVVAELPGINTSYKVTRLAAGGESLPDQWQEASMHGALLGRGEQLWRDPGAVMVDAGCQSVGRSAMALYHHGRLHGGQRSSGARAVSRLGRLVVAPLVPAVLWARIAGPVRAAGLGGTFLRTVPWTLFLLSCWALGEGVGALCGPGDSGGRWT